MGKLNLRIISCLMLIGCASCMQAHVNEASQIGERRYLLTATPGVVNNAAITEAINYAQNFCRNKEYDFAEITARREREAEFFCLKTGEKLNYRSSANSSSMPREPMTCINMGGGIIECD